MDDLDTITDFLYGPGAPMAGSAMSDDEALAKVAQHFPGRPFCLVRQWIWADLQLTEAERAVIARSGLQPVMMLAHAVVFDSRGRCPPGGWVRSSLLKSYSDGCFFETGNTIYVLLGMGCKKTARPSVVLKVF
ncbi:hypothetical protein D3C78_1141590 [compost metagenome]